MTKFLNRYFLKFGVVGLFIYMTSLLGGLSLPMIIANKQWSSGTHWGYFAFSDIYLMLEIMQALGLLFWGLFFIGFALRVIGLLEERCKSE